MVYTHRRVQPAASCMERDILRGRYRADLRVYIDAASRLEKASQEDFDIIYDEAERARTAWEQARERLNTHLAEHGCEV
jgi:hypothetical protein